MTRANLQEVAADALPYLIGIALGAVLAQIYILIESRINLPMAPPCVIRVFSEGCFV